VARKLEVPSTRKLWANTQGRFSPAEIEGVRDVGAVDQINAFTWIEIENDRRWAINILGMVQERMKL